MSSILVAVVGYGEEARGVFDAARRTAHRRTGCVVKYIYPENASRPWVRRSAIKVEALICPPGMARGTTALVYELDLGGLSANDAMSEITKALLCCIRRA